VINDKVITEDKCKFIQNSFCKREKQSTHEVVNFYAAKCLKLWKPSQQLAINIKSKAKKFWLIILYINLNPHKNKRIIFEDAFTPVGFIILKIKQTS